MTMNETISDMMVDTWNNYSIAGMKVEDFIVYKNTLKDCLRDGKALFDKDFTIADIDTVDSVLRLLLKYNDTVDSVANAHPKGFEVEKQPIHETTELDLFDLLPEHEK
ncbi:hypothetical protein LZD76_06445 [Lactobacillus mulieris]|uniref:hypothetical protein n=2 Tax=Lactobacillus mulieris TaxID=2508708 RepID=UPI001F180B44|nr:hypothetical protein [Lactobacillus mulieris]MCF1784083.1 hypothetical protein [Lactobacillus mulieris]MCW8124765.1 hypothetical protein [Lactobacillus mulieris]MDK6563263.1 hypothetical protein [Lactobacillus mulieris]MDK7327898.1 hypothetical protein [Lactobacillus mulieris]MDK8082494.1 hypothetical protein [Lactobacillus mulieris]